LKIPKDLLVYTLEEYETLSQDISSLTFKVKTEGKKSMPQLDLIIIYYYQKQNPGNFYMNMRVSGGRELTPCGFFGIIGVLRALGAKVVAKLQSR